MRQCFSICIALKAFDTDFLPPSFLLSLLPPCLCMLFQFPTPKCIMTYKMTVLPFRRPLPLFESHEA